MTLTNRSCTFSPSKVALCALLFALGTLSNAARAESVDEDSLSVPTQAACSQRYPLAVGSPSFVADRQEAKQRLRSDFDARHIWGANDNLEIDASAMDRAALKVHYPAKSSSPSDAENTGIPLGGAGFQTRPRALAGAERACLSYKVYFPAGFDFVKGGKLPGLYGGEAPSGGTQANGKNGFSMRFMWRTKGQGELYEYVTNQDGDYGASAGRGTWTFATGRWVKLEQEVVLNTPGKANGLARVWVDGHPVLEQRGIVYRTTDQVTIDGLMFSTFFGGTGKGWRTPRDQAVSFADFRLYAP